MQVINMQVYNKSKKASGTLFFKSSILALEKRNFR